jgi:hypothetical protein
MNQTPFIKNIRRKSLLPGIVLLFGAGTGSAYALDEIYSPNVEYRELSLEYAGSHTFDDQSDKNAAIDHALVVEAGIAPRWMIEASAGFSKEPDADTKFSDFELETRYQLVESGEYWLDAGFLVAYGFAAQSQQPDSIEVKLLLQKDFGKYTSTANIGFSQDLGTYSASGGADYVALVNTRYRYNEYFQPGLEIQSDFGQSSSFGHYNQQEHYIGPAAYGRLFGRMKYQIAYLFGASDAAAQSAARIKLEYEIHF